MRRFFWIGVAAFALLGTTRNLSIHTVPPKDAERLLAEGGVLVLDVRSDKEFQDSHLANAKLLPVQDIHKRLSELPTDKTQPILVYCGTGVRSSQAAHILYHNGYKDIYVIAGGLHAWIAAQKPIQVPAPLAKK